MDARFLETQLRIEHRHSDGSWSRLERSEHTSVDHDPERAWGKGRIYQCTTCDEQVRISPDQGSDDAHR